MSIKENGSPAFDEFLAILGETVELKNYTGYTAGLDVQYGNTGNTTVVTKVNFIKKYFLYIYN